MNMYAIVKEQTGKMFPAFPHYLEPPVPEEDKDISDIEVTIQTHPTKPDVGITYRRLEFGYNDSIAYKFTGEWDDWTIADEDEVLAQAIHDARRWLVLERGGWSA